MGFKIGQGLHDVLKREEDAVVPVGIIQAAESAVMIESFASAQANDLCYPPGVERRVYRKTQHFSDIYNGMVYPFTRHTIRGIIWYQGNQMNAKYGIFKF